MLLGLIAAILTLTALAFVYNSWAAWIAAVALLLVLVAFLSQSWWMPKTWWRALFYPNGRPRRITRFINAEGAWLSALGIMPEFVVMCETRGRRSGKIRRVPLVVATVDGKRYVVSMLGENVDWVHNVRAAGGDAVLRYGRMEEVTLREIPVAQRAPILKAYLARAPGGRPHFDVDRHAPLADFERIAVRYPVFEILPR